MNAEATSSTSVDITDYVAVIRRRWKLVVACGIGLMVLALLYSLTRPTQYVSRAQIALPAAEGNLTEAQADTFTEIEVVKSESVAVEAAKKLKTQRSVANLRTHLSVSAPTAGRVLSISFADSSARAAQRGAQAFTDAYIEYRSGLAEAQQDERAREMEAQITAVDDNVEGLQRQIDELGDDETERERALNDQIDRLNLQRVNYSVTLAGIRSEPIERAEVITPAVLPSGPQRSGVVRNGILGLVGGLVIGCALAFVRERFDEQVRDTVDIRGLAGVPSLGAVPMLPESMRYPPFSLVAVHAPETTQADAFRRLRTAVTIASDDVGAKVIAVTSAVAGEGKSTVAANLAVTLEQSGKRVLMISADLRRPAVEQLLEVPSKPGLVEVLLREVPLEEALYPVGRMTVLPAGRHHASPTDLLQAPTMRTILEQARTSYDVTIVDTPPVLAVADVLGIASMVGGLIMVVAVAETSEAQVADAAEQLKASGGKLLGVVLNRSGGAAPGYYDQYRRPTVT